VTIRAAREAAGIQPVTRLRVEGAGDGRVIVTREERTVRALADWAKAMDIQYRRY